MQPVNTNVTIENYITAVKEGLTTFLRAVEEKLKLTDIENLESKIDELVGNMVPGIVNDLKSKGQTHKPTNNDTLLTLAVKRIFMKLIVIVRKVAGEVEFLGTRVFGKIIDEIKPTVDTLDKNLKAATNTSNSDSGTAQAVDKAIGKVKTMVEHTIEKKFESDVKKPVVDAIQGLDAAVTQYDTKGKEQVKEAAKKAITAAANEISKSTDVELSDVKNMMESFSKAYDPIKSGLEGELHTRVDESMAYDGQTYTFDVDKVLTNYKIHMRYDGQTETNSPNGKLPEEIKKIDSEGLQELRKHISGSKIDSQTFEGPFGKIESELDEIKKLIGDDGLDIWYNNDNKGIKKYLDLFKKGLDNTVRWDPNGVPVKGLQHLMENIKKLRELTFGPRSKAIGKAVDEIKLKVDDLEKQLSDDKNDVINRLKDVSDKGLGSSEKDWAPNGKGPKISGLGRIRSELHEANNKFPGLTDEIKNATDIIMNKIQTVLKDVEMKLSDSVMRDDVLDQLEELRKRIGTNGETDPDSLQGIHKKISALQVNAFTNNPRKIEEAKKHVEGGLQAQMNILKNEVTNTLNELINKGFGGDENWNNNNAKGFDHINTNLQNQQGVLSHQPGQIESGINEITDELQSLRTELQGTGDGNPQGRGVMKNLEHLIKQIGKNNDAGLKNIKTEIESLRTSQVPKVTGNLNTMSTEITNAAGQLGLNLNQLENPHIDVKLKGIQSGLTNLRLTDLAAAIKLCDDFLSKADEIEKNTVNALLKHVDDEVDDAINDLTKEARALYVDSVKEALALLAKKVNEDLEQLPGDINHDLKIGYKGFMNTVEGENGENINKLKCVESRELKHLSATFAGFFGEVNEYVRKEITRLHYEQNKEKNPSLPPTAEPHTPKLNDVYKALTALLAYLKDNDGGTDRLTELVERLTKTQSNLVPSDFKHPSTPLLDTVSRGLSKFAGEFSNTYISAYSGQRCREEHAHKYAKVLLSMIPMTYKALSKLMVKCENEWKHLHISNFTADERDNALGNYLTRCGYSVSSSGSEQHGELNHMFTGAGIKELLATPTESVDIEMTVGGEPIENGIDFITIISLLYNLLCHYFQVCHIPVPPELRYPCTVRDMLSWLSGLQYTQVADKLPEHCKALLNRQCHDGDTPNRDDPIMAKCIESLPFTIATTCSRSTALLTAIQGNGHGFDLAAYPYSVDFSNNRARLHYPADPAELLEMLREIACRLCRVLCFLYSQCCRSTARVKGWRECTYGRQVQSHNWQCKQVGAYSSTISTTATATATAASSSTTIHGCPPTSPLQSFLSDSCHGLLPHTLTAADMKIECANCTANLPGQQCLTPLGFWDLGFAASISGTGWDLAKHLGNMCRDADSCLFVLCRILSYLCPAAPSSLADLFALYKQLLRKWDPHDRVRHLGGTYTDASVFISHLNTDGIDSLFPLWKELHGSYENHRLTSAIASLAGHDHKSHDALSSLSHDSTCQSPSGCAPYLQPLGLHANHTYPRKHAGLYITWIMYLAWQFWELLCELLQALDNIDCTASGCATCPCQPGTHGVKDSCHCPSIVQCAGPLPTLYRYGFTYRNANLVTGNYAMRCGDLNAQLKEALHSAHFTELFRQIDQLIWHIRMPFLYFLIALWSLVALYILHTFLYRLDIFHIRSHLLTTKASHLIDVKALLIPSRKMLSLYDASYFEDDASELLDAT